MLQTNSSKRYPNADQDTEATLDDNHSVAKIIRFVGDRKKVIDFGCSTGYLARFLQQHDCTITGVEINPEDAKLAEEYCNRVLVTDLDLESIPALFPEEKFDVAVFGDVLEHLKNPWKVLEEAQFILNPDGYIIASIPNIAHGAVRLALLRGEFQYSKLGILDDTHLRFFTRKTVQDLFDYSGYLIDEIQTTKVGIFDDNNCIPQNTIDEFDQDLIDKLLINLQLDEDADTLQFVIKAFPDSIERRHKYLQEQHSKLIRENERVAIAHRRAVQEKERLTHQLETLEIANNVQLQLKEQIQLQLKEQDIQSNQEIQVIQKKFEAIETSISDLQGQLNASQLQVEQANNLLARDIRKCELLEETIIAQEQNNHKIQTQLDLARQAILQTQNKLSITKLEIHGMKSSKFWQLRAKWFSIRNFLGFKNPDISVKQALFQKLYSSPLLRPSESSPILNDAVRILPASVPVSDDPLYQQWLNQNYPTSAILNRLASSIPALRYQPLISIVVPVHNTSVVYLRQMIDSVLDQIYLHWELCLADDASSHPDVRAVLEEYALKDCRIRTIFRTENGNISLASNSALGIATGDFIALLDHDDLLTPDALYEVIVLLNQHPGADMIYSDEDKIDDAGNLSAPFFKPDWCPDSFLARMYTCHFGVYRREVIELIGGFRAGYEGSQDYDLVLRFTEKTENIFHIPKILYHWRIHPQSAASCPDQKPYAAISAKRALTDALVRRKEPGQVLPVKNITGHYTIRYEIKNHPKVSIIIPTKDLAEILDTCLISIFEKTLYSNYEVIIVDNGSIEETTKNLFSKWQEKEPERFVSYHLDIPFNYSKINNFAVTKATGDYLLFLNNDTEILTPDWIEGMLEQAQRPSIGAVGALLLYPDNTIQHAGVIIGIGGVAGHSHKHFPQDSNGYFYQLKTVNNYSAITAACLMCKKEDFKLVGGFEEKLEVAFNDVDFCLKLIALGYRNIWVPHVIVYHYESKSRGYEDTPEKQKRFAEEIEYMKSKWKIYIDSDPCYNQNLTRTYENYTIGSL
jgi:O-antigen biosynthesis protein